MLNKVISANTRAILLLTAPLKTGHTARNAPVLTPGEYKRLAQQLHREGSQPSDLLGNDASILITKLQAMIEPERLEELLGRGFLLSQAIEHWQARAIWVVSRADADYPRRIKSLLKENSPAIFYGCGNRDLLNAGGLAVVGSRHVDDLLIRYTEEVGRLAARSLTAVVSGGARGVDQAAMRGALDNGGRAIGVLADSLERAVVNRENRDFLLENQLVLISPYDPSAGFYVGNAMQRNKLIYALADAALVVSSDLGKGGTWNGAVEQLEKYHFVPLFVRTGDNANPGLAALKQKGALAWPEPRTPDDLKKLMLIK